MGSRQWPATFIWLSTMKIRKLIIIIYYYRYLFSSLNQPNLLSADNNQKRCVLPKNMKLSILKSALTERLKGYRFDDIKPSIDSWRLDNEIDVWKEFNWIKNIVWVFANLVPLVVHQVFVALIRNSPRLSGAPQLVQRLLDWPKTSFTERSAFILYTIELHLSHTTLTIIHRYNPFIR